MKKRALFIVPLFLLLLCTTWGEAVAGGSPIRKVKEATEVLSDIIAIPERGIPPALLRNAYGIAVIPNVIKVGFVVGGRRGKGVIVIRTSNGEWSNPSFITLTGGSVGWQIGAQSTDVILVFKGRKGVDGVRKGKFTLGADASVAAGPVGRHVAASTDIQLKAEIYSYSRSRGLFAGVALEGAALQIDHNANETFYREEGVSVGVIFRSDTLQAPPAAAGFIDVLSNIQE
ncbi:MAG: lipid-binding SYLF domain-containing protein [Thermodesulfobacteriota bacterium]